MGHATRSRVVLEHLARQGHEVRVVVSGRAHGFLRDALVAFPNVTLHEIQGLTLSFDGPALDLLSTLLDNLSAAPKNLVHNLEVYREIAEEGFYPEVVVSDYESWAYLYARRHRIPVISLDNMQILHRCRHEPEATAFRSFDFRLAKAAVRVKLPGAYHYLITTFFTPPVRKRRTTLVPPILRPAILAAERAPGEHLLVYQTAKATGDALVPLLQSLPVPCRVYGLGREGTEGNCTFLPFSEQGFVDDLRTARGVLANGGLSLMAEAVHLRVPMLSIPLQGQFEQELNARYLDHLGYGAFSPTLHAEAITDFLAAIPRYDEALLGWTPRDNTMLLACVDELLLDVSVGATRPDRLTSPALGKWEGAGWEDVVESGVGGD